MHASPALPFGVLWDMDGVLVDTGRFHLASWHDILIAAGHPFDEDVFKRTFGMNNHGVLSTVFGRPPSAEELVSLADAKEALFREMIAGQAEPLPGVRAWLARLQARGVRMAVASSAPQANIDVLLVALGLRDYFTAEVSAEKMPGKPDPAVFLEAARRVGLPPERCVVVEDAIAGVAAAKRAGMACLAVTTTNPREKLAAADWIVDSLADLPADAFDRLLAGEHPAA
jgi:beta-phosphoglucomutase family hydrolase